jgi:hypothetical protein
VPGTQAGTTLSKLIGQNVLMDDPNLLILYATEGCNVAAAQEYRLSRLACTGALASMVPGFAMPPQLVTGVQEACQILGYTDGNNQLLTSLPTTITPGPAAVCSQPVAAFKVPVGQHLVISIK